MYGLINSLPLLFGLQWCALHSSCSKKVTSSSRRLSCCPVDVSGCWRWKQSLVGCCARFRTRQVKLQTHTWNRVTLSWLVGHTWIPRFALDHRCRITTLAGERLVDMGVYLVFARKYTYVGVLSCLKLWSSQKKIPPYIANARKRRKSAHLCVWHQTAAKA